MIRFRFFYPLLCLAGLWLTTGTAFSQVKVLRVSPPATGAAIETVHGPHIALYDPHTSSRHRLILMIVGTGASAEGIRPFDSCFAAMGYHVVSLDYKNNVITTTCSNSRDSGCFDHFREEIVTGTPVSEVVQVDTVNSLFHRFQQLLAYLAKEDPQGGWQEFVRPDGQPRWERIITAGHSQGAGHAAWLGKRFRVDRVLMFSGPQDYLNPYHMPAGWQSGSSATPPSRFFAFLHRKDPFDVTHQLANCSRLMETRRPDTLAVQPGRPVRGRQHILITDIPTKNPHGSTLNPVFVPVWQYMLTARGRR
ncbi:BPSS1187 family protein [Compostibacter hankyongensis]